MTDIKSLSQSIMWIAHRGYSLKAFENSYDAFLLAAKLPFWGIETDVHQTKDGIFVIHHDANMKHTTGVDMEIRTSTLNDLRTLTYKGTTQKIVTFKEYLDVCVNYQKIAIIELKPFFTSAMIIELLKMIQSVDYLSQCVFISFEADNLLRLRAIDPNVKIQLLVNRVDSIIINLCNEQKFDLNIDHIILNQELIDKLHSHQIQVNCWTIRTKDEATKYINLGVDFITTDGF